MDRPPAAQAARGGPEGSIMNMPPLGNEIIDRLTIGQRFINRAFDLRGLGRWLLLGCLVGVVAGGGAILFHAALDGLRSLSFNLLMGLNPVAPPATIPHSASRPPDRCVRF